MAADTQKGSGKLGWLPGAAAILAFIACNGLFIVVAVLSVFGITIAINPHIQAAVVSLFAVLTLGFVFLGYRKHHVLGPMILSVLGAVVIVGSMYIFFNKIVETLGLLALIASAIWSWRTSKASVRSTATS
ncbi:MAG: MerC domain-containing protein [Betaproteobacteria bacterium]|nr:MerC domain-containing protein [Betaproteobacteria bacterium]MDH3435450.1 MerC domain-containing protein [Betaproteobacteria bacterium]